MNKWKNGKETTSTDNASKDKTTQSAKTEA